MWIKILLVIAIAVQAVASVYALRLVYTTKYNAVWILFIAGFLLLSIERVMQFMLVNGHGVPGIALAARDIEQPLAPCAQRFRPGARRAALRVAQCGDARG